MEALARVFHRVVGRELVVQGLEFGLYQRCALRRGVGAKDREERGGHAHQMASFFGSAPMFLATAAKANVRRMTASVSRDWR